MREMRHYEAALDALVRAVPQQVRQQAPVALPPEKSKGYVFLSYADQDVGFIDGLQAFLREHSYQLWGFGDSERDYTSSIARELESRISNSAALLAILSPSWKDSEWTERELLYSQAVNIPSFLLQAREMPPSILLMGRLVIDFVHDDAAFDKLRDELKKKSL